MVQGDEPKKWKNHDVCVVDSTGPISISTSHLLTYLRDHGIGIVEVTGTTDSTLPLVERMLANVASNVQDTLDFEYVNGKKFIDKKEAKAYKQKMDCRKGWKR